MFFALSLHRRWNLGEPNNIGDEDCVEMYTSGLWNDQACTDVIEGLICDKASGSNKP